MRSTFLLTSGLAVCVSNTAFAEPVVSVRDAVAEAARTPVLTQRLVEPRRASLGGRGMPADWTPRPGTRIGGDTPLSATVIAGLPFYDSGNNGLFTDAGDEVCPDTVTGPGGGLDVWYQYTNSGYSTIVSITLCDPGTDFDTKVYVYSDAVTPGHAAACDDDTCSAGLGFPWVSEVVAHFPSSTDFWIVVDAWSSGDVGNYSMEVAVACARCVPCVVDCEATDIINPGTCSPGEDGDDGCFAANQDEFFSINCDETVCGTFFTDRINNARDTDWYELVLTQTNDVTAILASEAPYGYQLAFIDPTRQGGCAPPGNDQPVSFLVSSGEGCVSTGVILTGIQPGMYWLTATPFDDPDGFFNLDCPNEQGYRLAITCDCGPYLEGNTNGDNAVDFDDLNAVLGAWGTVCGQ